MKKNLHSPLFLLLVLSLFINPRVNGQCPPNLDFETGTFVNWQCWTGNAVAVGGTNELRLNTSAPNNNQHLMLNAIPGNGMDEYGQFPKNCPNGSGHSIKLGNSTTNAQAEGVSYTFTIPATANKFSLIYYYAVVFQDPGHSDFQQPRLQIEIKNITDNTIIGCSSFSFIATAALPGFTLSPIGSQVWFKDWSASSINLDGNAGKTIQLFFKTGDCTLGGHFGYAYVDVKTECSSTFVGATYCPDDTAINVVAPYGYQEYKWFNDNFTQVLGTTQTLRLSPPPPPGTNLKVELTPFNGYGCKDTLTSELQDSLTVTAYAGRDTVSCAGAPVQLGGPSRETFVYKWSPVTGLNNPNISNPISTATVTTRYFLTVTNQGGGCITMDTVDVFVDQFDPTLNLVGSASYCTASGQSAVLKVALHDSIQWYRNNIAITGANATSYTVTQSGDYKAMLFSRNGCSISTVTQHIDIYESPRAGFTINNNYQCFSNHEFIFTDTGYAPANTIYSWYMGDGNILNTNNVTYSYAQAGLYNVKLLLTAEGGCKDSAFATVKIYPTPDADFTVKDICTNLPLPLINKTINNSTDPITYLWDFGNGFTSTDANPVYRYPVAGDYVIKLSVTQCPLTTSTKEIPVKIEAPVPGIIYPMVDAVMNFPEPLKARPIGTTVVWNPPTSLDNYKSYTPNFRSLNPQTYYITLTTPSGCVTVDTQVVKTHKKIEIYVPTVFSPGGDGKNDFLRPLLMGFKSVNYFSVYNRWGRLLFTMQNDRPGWDGRVNNQLQEMQTVVWMIEATDVDGKVHQRKGTTVLMR